MIITTRHIFSVPGYSIRDGFCRNGLKLWCARYGFKPSEFLRTGVDSERILATGDALGAAVVEWAEQCEGRDGQS